MKSIVYRMIQDQQSSLSKRRPAIRFLTLVGVFFFFCFTCSSVADAKSRRAPNAVSATTKKPKKALLRKKREENVAKKRRAKAVAKRKFRASKKVLLKKQRRRPSVERKKQQSSVKKTRKNQRSRPAVSNKQQRQQVRARRKHPQAVTRRRAQVRPPSVESYLTQLNAHNQRNAQIGGMDKLYSKNLLGQGKTVAVVEHSGTWAEMQDLVNSSQGFLSKSVRERYKNNFLPSIGQGRGGDPNVAHEWDHRKLYHGSKVASVVLDLAPHTKVLPVSTYHSSSEKYRITEALMDLSRRPDVSVINISSGCLESNKENQACGYKADGTVNYKFKCVYSPKILNAFKAIASTGKVIVFAAGNEGGELLGDEFLSEIQRFQRDMGYLAENLDPETRKSIIFAGALDPETRASMGYSNRPGQMKKAQDMFLFAPTNHKLSYKDDIVGGTSNSAPYICAAITNLLSRFPRMTAKQAAQALLESADKKPDVRTYGRGIIRADKALDILEERNR